MAAALHAAHQGFLSPENVAAPCIDSRVRECMDQGSRRMANACVCPLTPTASLILSLSVHIYPYIHSWICHPSLVSSLAVIPTCPSTTNYVQERLLQRAMVATAIPAMCQVTLDYVQHHATYIQHIQHHPIPRTPRPIFYGKCYHTIKGLT